jgi:tetratricopeptide (TPR) repeat protein
VKNYFRSKQRNERRLRLSSCVVLSTLIVTCSVSITLAQSTAQAKRLATVATLIRDNKINEAERQLVSVLRATPNEPAALNLMGTIRAKQGRLQDAESLFLRAVKSDPKFVGARMNLAYLYLLKREPDKTIVQLNEVLKLDPTNVDAAQRLAELLLSQRKYDECLTLIDKLRLSQTIPATLLVLSGDAHLGKGDSKKAEDDYLLALEGKLENAGALLGLAQIAQLKGESRETSLYLTRVASLASDSQSPDFLYRFGFAALKAGMANEAKAAFERADSLTPNQHSYLLGLGIAWLRKGDLFEAEKVFRRLIKLFPDSSQGQLHLGYVLLNQKKYDEARQWFEKCARSQNPVPEVFYYLGLVAQEQNDDANAIRLLEKAVQQLPSYSHARIALGSSYMKLRNYTRAQEELETAVKLDPEEPKAHYNLALLYARLKNTEKAQQEMSIVETLKSKGATDSGVVVLPPTAPPR